MDSILSLTIKFIEQVFSSKTLRSDLASLNRALHEGDFAKACTTSKKLISESRIEITDTTSAEAFISEVTFALGLSEFLCAELSNAEDEFIKCIKADKFPALSYLFLSLIYEKQGDFSEALVSVLSAKKISPGYYYFNVAELRILILMEHYEEAARTSRELVIDIGGRGEEINLLPQISPEAIERSAISPIVENLFLHSNFTYELLFLSAESHFNIDSYEEAFEYYKEAAAVCRPGEGKVECLYKMACCKIRLNDFITARELLESLIDVSSTVNGAEKFRQNALLDLASLYEFTFSNMNSCIDTYLKYCETSNYSDHDVLVKTGRLLYEGGRFNEALFHLCKLEEKYFDKYDDLDFLIGNCYFETGRHELAASHLEKVAAGFSGGREQPDSKDFRTAILLIVNYIILGKFQDAQSLLSLLGSLKLAGLQKVEHSSLKNFFDNYRECVNVVILSPVFYKSSETPIAVSFNVSVLKGFVKTDSFVESDVPAIMARLADMLTNCIVMIGEKTPPEYSIEISSDFGDIPVVSERFLKSFQRKNFGITVTDNPLKYNSLEPGLEPLIFIIHVLNSIASSAMPDLFMGPWPKPDRRNFLETQKASFLKFYDFFKRQRNRFSLISTFCKITIKGDTIFPQNASGENGNQGEEEKDTGQSRLWPYMINFKNVELPDEMGSETQRTLVNGCDEIFLYNFLRTCKQRIDQNEIVHIITPPQKTGPVGELLSFILKKLEYAKNEIAIHGDVSEIICSKKVGKVIGSKVKSVTTSFDALATILAMQSGYRYIHEIDNALEEFVSDKIGFSHFSCDYDECPDFEKCCLKEIFSSYSAKEKMFHISSCNNYLAAMSRPDDIPAFSSVENLIFFDLPSFCTNADDFFSENIEIERLRSELSSPPAGMSDESAEKIKLAAEYISDSFPIGLKWFECKDEIGELFKVSEDALKNIGETAIEGYPELLKLKILSGYFSRPSVRGLVSLGASNTGYGLTIKFELNGWTEGFGLGKGARRVFAVNPEDPGQHFQSRLSKTLKFFRTYNLSEKYLAATGKSSKILFLRNNSATVNSIVQKFTAAGKKAGIFFLDYPAIPRRETESSELADGTKIFFVRTPSGIEPEIVGLDCAVIDINYVSAERSLSMVSMMKNTFSKYGNDIVWIVVSTPVRDACFSSRPGTFSTIDGMTAFSNELEYADSFKEKAEIRLLISATPSQTSYEGRTADTEYGHGKMTFNSSELSFAMKSWNRVRHQLMNGTIRNLITEDGKMLEFATLSICFFSSLEKTHRTLFLYCEDESDASRIERILISCGIAFGTLKKREDHDHVIIITGRQIDSAAQYFKSTRSSEFMLLTYNSLVTRRASLSFKAFRYSEISKISSIFGNSLHSIALHSIDGLRLQNPEENFSASIAGSVFTKISSAGTRTRPEIKLRAASIEEAAAKISDAAAAEVGTHIICAGCDDISSLRDLIATKPKHTTHSVFFFTSFEEGPSYMMAAAERSFRENCPVIAHLVSTCRTRLDAAAFGGKASSLFGGRKISVREIFFDSRTLSGPESIPGYHEIRIIDYFFRDCSGKNLLLDGSFIHSINPVSFFADYPAERCLAILNESGRISLGASPQGLIKPSIPTGHTKLSELARAGIIEMIHPDILTPGETGKWELDLDDLIAGGRIRVLKHDELFDRISADYPDKHMLYFSEPSPIQSHSDKLKKLAILRKRFIQELYDLEGFSSGKWINLPFSDASDLTYNDYQFIREICALTWFSICDFKKMADGSAGIRNVYRSGNVDFKLEKLAGHLVETLEAVNRLFEKGRFPGPAGTADIVGAILSARSNYEKLQKAEFSPSYVLKLLRLLSLYGMVNFCAHGFPGSGGAFSVSVEKDYSLVDYTTFLRIIKKISKYDL